MGDDPHVARLGGSVAPAFRPDLATDSTFDSGAPGIGFNFGVGDTNVDHGFTSYEVDTYDD
jgi:hypothetical protein